MKGEATSIEVADSLFRKYLFIFDKPRHLILWRVVGQLLIAICRVCFIWSV